MADGPRLATQGRVVHEGGEPLLRCPVVGEHLEQGLDRESLSESLVGWAGCQALPILFSKWLEDNEWPFLTHKSL